MKFVLSPHEVHTLVVISRNPADPSAAEVGSRLGKNAKLVVHALKDLVLLEQKLVTVDEIKKRHTPMTLRTAEHFLGITPGSRSARRVLAVG